MRFWKIFAWIAFVFSLIFRRGKDVRVRKVNAPEPGTPDQDKGRGWRRVSKTQPAPRRSPKE